jgi:hypothetical protein
MHEDLAVNAEHVQQANVTVLDGRGFLVGQLEACEARLYVFAAFSLERLVAIQFVQEFLQVVETH